MRLLVVLITPLLGQDDDDYDLYCSLLTDHYDDYCYDDGHDEDECDDELDELDLACRNNTFPWGGISRRRNKWDGSMQLVLTVIFLYAQVCKSCGPRLYQFCPPPLPPPES